ncbi:E3 ubiquitin-protein ligase UHRF1 [Nymphon striatum]|nr:E3 ubiquitin-protein ligase UHRF1 [Nymphon striatum]
MWIQVRTMDGSKSSKIDGLSRLTKIEELRQLIENEFSAPPDCQRLFYRGKQLENEHTLFDYDVQLNDIIQMIITKAKLKTSDSPTSSSDELDKKLTESEESDKENAKSDGKSPSHTYTDCLIRSKYYKVGDHIDIMDQDTKNWTEGQILKITKLKNNDSAVLKESVSTSGGNENTPDDLLTFHVTFDSESDQSHQVKMEAIRLRARQKLDVTELSEGMKVMVNYNLDEPGKIGHYFDMKIAEVKNVKKKLEVYGTLYVGNEQSYMENIKLSQLDKIWKIEPLIDVKDREKSYDDNIPSEKRSVKPSCEKCNDNPRIKCKVCSCVKCGGKDSPNKQILCDECDGPYHLWCLDPPLTAVPDVDYWFCPNCKNDETEIVRAGENLKSNKKKAKMPSAVNKTQRDWGRGMATAGRTKRCTIVPENHFGPIPGIEVGSCWKFRMQVGESGIHRPQVAGIHGREKEGSYSICLSGGYEDDVDNGDEFTYTGSGGRDLSGNKRTAEQSCNQELTRMNRALAINCNAPFNKTEGAESKDCKKGKPVRVVRNYKGNKHSKYCPTEGNRYDGIYKVVKYWPAHGKSGFIVWRYLFRRDDPTPAPWTEEGKKRIQQLGLTMEYPPGYEEKKDEKLPKEKDIKAFSPSKMLLTLLMVQKWLDMRNATVLNIKLKHALTPVLKPFQVLQTYNFYFPASLPTASVFKKSKVEEYTLSDSIKDRIKEDDQNKKLWDECTNLCSEGRKKFLEKVEELFTCVCCQDLVHNPITIECHHNICKDCLKRSFKSEVYSCPHCRFDLGKNYAMTINDSLLKILLKLFPGYESGRHAD